MEGSVAEWSKALVLGTSHFDGVGSNPTAAKNFSFLLFFFFALSFEFSRLIKFGSLLTLRVEKKFDKILIKNRHALAYVENRVNIT